LTGSGFAVAVSPAGVSAPTPWPRVLPSGGRKV